MTDGLARWDFEGRVIAVTNAATPRGAAQVEAFTKHGAKVYSLQRVNATVDGGARATAGRTAQLDASLAEFAAEVATAGQLDALVINDRSTPNQQLIDVSVDDWQQLILGGVTGAFLAAKHLVPLMLPAKRGKVVCTTGPEASAGMRHRAHVGASRHAISGFVKSLAIELAEYQINVNVAAGATEVDAASGNTAIQALTHGVMWLASDAARFVTGSVVTCDLETHALSS